MTSDRFEEIADKILSELSIHGSGYGSIQKISGDNGFDFIYVATNLKEQDIIEDFNSPEMEYNPFMYRIKPKGIRIVDDGGYVKWMAERRAKKEEVLDMAIENLYWVRWLGLATIAIAFGTIGLLIVEIVKLIIEHQSCR